MFTNEVTILKRENEIQSINLRDDDRRVIKDIMKSMSMFKVNSYDAQVIRRDLIGMAFEMKLRNSSLQETIGDDVKGFTDEVIMNSFGPSMWEIILNFLMKLSGYFFTWFTLLAIGAYSSLTWKANPIVYLYFIGAVVLIFITEGILAPRFITEKGFKKNLYSLISMLLFVILTSIIFLLNDKHNTREVNGGIIIATSGLVYLISVYLNSNNIGRLAKDKKNFIDDL
jgi:DNA-binding ferritin-like protein (Dps family)